MRRPVPKRLSLEELRARGWSDATLDDLWREARFDLIHKGQAVCIPCAMPEDLPRRLMQEQVCMTIEVTPYAQMTRLYPGVPRERLLIRIREYCLVMDAMRRLDPNATL